MRVSLVFADVHDDGALGRIDRRPRAEDDRSRRGPRRAASDSGG